MISVITLQDAEILLTEIKELIARNGIIYLSGRPNNAQTLLNLGITTNIRRSIVDSLGAIDYCSGPEPDRKFPNKSVAIFGKSFGGTELYIKFSYDQSGNPVVCISFHEADRPMSYQFK
jgi:hypothetical protein